jgi:hypothetical protein
MSAATTYTLTTSGNYAYINNNMPTASSYPPPIDDPYNPYEIK